MSGGLPVIVGLQGQWLARMPDNIEVMLEKVPSENQARHVGDG
jgi:hypothetical protein